MPDDVLCHTVTPGDERVALCGAVLDGHDWCPSHTGGTCTHEACPMCEAVLYDDAQAAAAAR